jgi:EAL domain-containing protein (putative c-di-GMP-specific phosphodiesterase class I)
VKKTGSNLVLEEVETMEQYLMGLDAGGELFQGYYFALPAADIQSPDSLPPSSRTWPGSLPGKENTRCRLVSISLYAE